MISRSRLLVIFLALFCLAAAVPSAHAAYSETGAQGNEGPSGGSCSACGGNAPAYWYELGNINKALPPIPKDFAWDGKYRKSSKNKIVLQNLLTREMMEPCRARGPRSRWGKSSYCVLWRHTQRRETGVNEDITNYEIHRKYPGASENEEAGIGVTWNVRIWRENPATRRFETLFERKLGAYPRYGNETDPGPGWWKSNTDIGWNAAIYNNWAWYQGGALNRKFLYNAADVLSAGPLSSTRYGNCVGRFRDVNQRNNPPRSNLRFDLGLVTKPVMYKGKKKDVFQPVLQRMEDNSKVPTRVTSKNYCYWEGSQIGPRAFEWGKFGSQIIANAFDRDRYRYRTARGLRPLPLTQFGTKESKTDLGYFSKESNKPVRVSRNFSGVIGAGTREAIEIQWTLRQGNPEIDVRIEGAPGLFYAVQIVRTDSREDILPSYDQRGSRSRKQFWVGWPRKTYRKQSQIFHTYLVNPIAPSDIPPPPCCGPKDTDEGDPPQAGVNLATPERTMVMEPNEQDARIWTIPADTSKANRAAVFPTSVSLTHYTPQMDYSCKSSYTDAGYVSYDVSPLTVDAFPQAQYRAPNKPPTISCPKVKFSEFRKGLTLDPSRSLDNPDGADAASSALGSTIATTTWLKPTLENPCGFLDANKLFSGNTVKSWSPSPRQPWLNPSDTKCSDNQFNAWDDLFTATANWQAYWTHNPEAKPLGFYDQLGYMRNKDLRCGAQSSVAVKVADCADFWTAQNASSGDTAQGFLLLPSEGTNKYPVRVTLPTQKGLQVTGAQLWARGETYNPGDTDYVTAESLNLGNVGGSISDPINTISGQAEINYCNPGLPPGATVRKSGAELTWPDVRKGDENCEGYALKWRWANTPVCKATAPAFPPPPALANLISAQSLRIPSGRKAKLAQIIADMSASDFDYSSLGWASGWATTRSPFVGGRPGTAENPARCQDGRYRHDGWWDIVNQSNSPGASDFVQTDFKVANRPVGFGFGENNDGPAIPTGALFSESGSEEHGSSSWVAEFDLQGAGKWRMLASYEGYKNKTWWYKNDSGVDREFVQVLAPRNSR